MMIKKVRGRDAQNKLKAKQYADRKSNVRPSSIEVHDLILARNERKGKQQPIYEPLPYTVIKKKGSMVTASRVGTEKNRKSGQ